MQRNMPSVRTILTPELYNELLAVFEYFGNEHNGNLVAIKSKNLIEKIKKYARKFESESVTGVVEDVAGVSFFSEEARDVIELLTIKIWIDDDKTDLRRDHFAELKSRGER